MATDTTADVPEVLQANQQHDPGELSDTILAIEEELGDQIACEGCAKPADPPYRTVLAYPRPWADESALLCQDCWAEEVARQSTLSERGARILALKLAGFEEGEIREVVGSAGGSVESVLSDLREEFDELREGRDERDRSEALLSEVFE